MGDHANVAAHAGTLKSSRTSFWLAPYIPFLEGDVCIVRLCSASVLLLMSPAWIDSGTQLGGWVEDLMTVLDSETVDGSV